MSGQLGDPELERWNGRFAAKEYVFGTARNAFLSAQSALLRSGMRALCVADGEGRNSVWLARQGLRITAFDFSPIGIEKARKLAEQSGVNVEYRLSRVDDWHWGDEPYDVVAAIFVQFASPLLQQRMFEGMKQALKTDGLLLLQGYRPARVEYGAGGQARAR